MDPALVGLIQTVISGGPALIFALLWYLERAERKSLSDKLFSTLESMGKMNEAWLKVLKGAPRD